MRATLHLVKKSGYNYISSKIQTVSHRMGLTETIASLSKNQNNIVNNSATSQTEGDVYFLLFEVLKKCPVILKLHLIYPYNNK